MDANFMHLWTAAFEAVELLGQATTPLDPHVHHARAVLAAALQHLHCEVDESDLPNPTEPTEVVSAPAGDGDLDRTDDPSVKPRSLADYRSERGMTVLQFGRWLGIAHFEYATVVHRRPVDRRIRDQIAYKLGVDWRAIAEFVPEQPPPRRAIAALPARPGAEPPHEPWYLLDQETGRIRSGPHYEPLPANAGHLFDYATRGAAQLIALLDFDGPFTEETQLPPEGYSAQDRELLGERLGEDDDDGGDDDDTTDHRDDYVAHIT